MTTTYPTHRTTADQLRPGDIILTAEGARDYAAFDVHHDPDRAHVLIWTSATDQDNGHPAVRTLAPQQWLTVARRPGDPRITRTTLTMREDGSVDVQTATDWTLPTPHVTGECRFCRYTTGHVSWCPDRITPEPTTAEEIADAAAEMAADNAAGAALLDPDTLWDTDGTLLGRIHHIGPNGYLPIGADDFELPVEATHADARGALYADAGRPLPTEK